MQDNRDNPLLKKITLPGRRFRLPSRGLFYSDGELDENVEGGEVEVFSMTTVDEITLRSPEFLFNGEAIDRVFRRCIPEIKKPLKLLSRDVDFLLAALRVVSYGGTYQINSRCPKCEERQQEVNKVKFDELMVELEGLSRENNVDISALMMEEKVKLRINKIKNRRSHEQTHNVNLDGIVLNKTTEISPEHAAKYKIDLSNGQIVQLMPMRMDTEVMAHKYQNEEITQNLNLVEEYVTFMLSCNIMNVDGVDDSDCIVEWVQRLPLRLKNELYEKVEDLDKWGTDFSYTVKCDDPECGYERDISTLLNPITFFMKPSELEEELS